MSAPAYVGRFAPSPTGPLHFGSLVAAVGSYLDAKAQGGRWYVRMEDVDVPRCQATVAAGMLHTLERYGFAWDGEVIYQSQRTDRYREVLAALQQQAQVYPCACTRKELADSMLASDGATVYPGTCRNGLPAGRAARAWRLRVDDVPVRFEDAVQGPYAQDVAREAGDFVLLRADGYFAYQLAVVVDDADQGVTNVVRGADLLASTPRQIFLQRCLGHPTPSYMHLPVVVNAAGEKLSKQTLAQAIDSQPPVETLLAALRFLGQVPAEADAAALRRTTTADLWSWAIRAWRRARVPRSLTLAAEVFAT